MKGVWLTNVASQVLFSHENIKKAIEICSEIGVTDIFICVWNDASTIYPSDVMNDLIGIEIQPEFFGRDPLKEVIQEAHAKKIKVHAWFEFGFSSSINKADGGPILKARPHWKAIDNNGNLVSKNGFQWMNAFHPEVQHFLNSLIFEVIKKYDVDGIQGDDRLPACPSSSGYDAYTSSLFAKENFSHSPPLNEKDYNWIKWRSTKLTQYLCTLTDSIKKINPSIIISMAPSIYPWSEEEYLQDWPSWVKLGKLDMIIPQIYRYNFGRYNYELDQILKYQLPKNSKTKFYPGILLQVDTYNPSHSFLDSMVLLNRKMGINGEVFFYYEGLKKYNWDSIGINAK
jgi:uncharacterized lipoprotein YddW (UPF0748 family)